MIMYACQNFGIRDIQGQIPKRHISNDTSFMY